MTYNLTTITDAECKDYAKAIQKELAKIKKAELPFTVYDWTLEKIKAGDIRLKEGFTPISGQYQVENTTYRGVSPEAAYKTWDKGKRDSHHPITLLQYLRLIQDYPDFLKEKLYLDFCADEVRLGSEFTDSPRVYQNYSSAKLDSYWASDANDSYGAFLAAWESKSDLRAIESPEPLTFDSEIKINDVVYVKKGDTSEFVSQEVNELREMRKELMSLSNKITGYLRGKK